MGRTLLFIVCLLLGSIPAMAQQRYEGVLLDQEDKTPVAYANIGIPGSETGTNSDSLGRFALQIPADAKDKMLSISLIGYEDYEVKVAAVLQQKTVFLKKNRQALGEVVIKPAKLTSAVLGNDVVCKSGDMGLALPYLYEKKKKGVVVKRDTLTEIGTLMKVKGRKTFVDSVQINVGICTHQEILYRLNIYEELDGEFKNILREPIYIRMKKEQVGNRIKIDLTDKNIVVNHNFIVSVEKVKDLGAGTFSICGKMFGAPMYLRLAYYKDKFLKLPVIGMGITSYVTFSEEEK